MWYVALNIKKFDVHSEKLQQNIEKKDAGIEILIKILSVTTKY